MDRRKSLKLLATGALAAPLTLSGCKNEDNNAKATEPVFHLDRSPDEILLEKKILDQAPFFTAHEMATLHILTDIIIPKDAISGSATEAGVPAFIEFIVKDMPQHQTPMRGGLRWLDMESLKLNGKAFKDCSQAQQLAMIDTIAYPEKNKGKQKQGVQFFNLLRNLTATGFFTSEMGVKDLGYAGNQATQWNGVAKEILDQYNIQYSEADLKNCLNFDTPPAG